MKNVAITMRIDNNLEYNEKRDCLDTNWYKLFNICNLNLILIPNNLLLLELILSNNKIDGFLFSGGNNINDKYTIERDYIEKKIIEFSIQNNIPILGICRGMQAIGNYFNLKLDKVNNHIGFHKIILNGIEVVKNSYHNYGFLKNDILENEFIIYGLSNDNVVESFKHKIYEFYGIMWHPERYLSFNNDDIELIKKIYNS